MRHNALINNRKIFTRRVVYDMDAEETSQNVPKAFTFSSPEGHTLCRLILAALLPYEPHDFQIEGIYQMLDGVFWMASIYLLYLQLVWDRPFFLMQTMPLRTRGFRAAILVKYSHVSGC